MTSEILENIKKNHGGTYTDYLKRVVAIKIIDSESLSVAKGYLTELTRLINHHKNIWLADIDLNDSESFKDYCTANYLKYIRDGVREKITTYEALDINHDKEINKYIKRNNLSVMETNILLTNLRGLVA